MKGAFPEYEQVFAALKQQATPYLLDGLQYEGRSLVSCLIHRNF